MVATSGTPQLIASIAGSENPEPPGTPLGRGHGRAHAAALAAVTQAAISVLAGKALSVPRRETVRAAARAAALRAALADWPRHVVAVVLVAGIASIVASIPSIQFTSALFSGMQGGEMVATFTWVGAIVGGLLGPFVRWLLYGVAFFVVSAVAFDPDGSAGDLFALTGWGFVPTIPAAIVNGVAAYLVFGGRQVPQNMSPQEVVQYSQSLQNDPVLVVSSVVGIAFLLWGAFLWTFAVKHARDLPLRESAITVAVPVAFAILLRLPGLLGLNLFGGGV